MHVSKGDQMYKGEMTTGNNTTFSTSQYQMSLADLQGSRQELVARTCICHAKPSSRSARLKNVPLKNNKKSLYTEYK